MIEDLKDRFPGIAIFSSAFRQVLPRNPQQDTTPKAEPKQRRPRTKLKDDTIVIVSKWNPYRAGTKAYDTFELFKRTLSVSAARAEAAAAGGNGKNGKYDIGYLRYASRDGYIKFE